MIFGIHGIENPHKDCFGTSKTYLVLFDYLNLLENAYHLPKTSKPLHVKTKTDKVTPKVPSHSTSHVQKTCIEFFANFCPLLEIQQKVLTLPAKNDEKTSKNELRPVLLTTSKNKT